MTQLRGQPSTRSTWGGHLALDAVVAYVDEELSPTARRRALEHLARCPECAGEVIAQTQARWMLRRAAAPSLPSSLLNSLRAIPNEAELPAPPAGLSVAPDGQLVSVLKPYPGQGENRSGEPHPGRRWLRDHRVRLGAGAAVTGLALGGFLVAGHLADPSGAAPASVSTASIGGASYLGSGTGSSTAPTNATTNAPSNGPVTATLSTQPDSARPSSVPARPRVIPPEHPDR